MIIWYRLDCGCEFKHKPQAGAGNAYEVAVACSTHGNPLSSATRPAENLPNPAPFLSVPQAPAGPHDHDTGRAVRCVAETLPADFPVPPTPQYVGRVEFDALVSRLVDLETRVGALDNPVR